MLLLWSLLLLLRYSQHADCYIRNRYLLTSISNGIHSDINQYRLYAKNKDKRNIKKLNRVPDSNGELPANRLDVRRPSVYKSIYSGGSGQARVMEQGKKREREIINPNRLRIIGGVAKGKKINSPDVYLRPMMAKVREAMFSTFEFMGLFEGNNTYVIDMFSGSGSVGLEALSRGAAHCTFVDFAENCIETCKKNSENCGFSGQVSTVCARVEDVLKNPTAHNLHNCYQLISITPPYQEVVYKDLIDAACNSPLLDSDSIVMIEYPEEMGSLPAILGEDKLYGVRNRKYGRTMLALYVYRPNKLIDMRPEEFGGW